MKGYKGVNKNFQCHDFQYEVGKTYKYDGAIELFSKGFHYCATPLAVLEYYPATDDNRFALIEANGEILCDDRTTFCTDEITIVRELTLEELIEIAKESCKTANYDVKSSTDSYSVASNTGFCGVATNTGDASNANTTNAYSLAINSGNYSIASTTYVESMANNTGTGSVAINMGTNSTANVTGYNSIAISAGNNSTATTKGERSVALVTDAHSSAVVTEPKSIAIATGQWGSAKGALGCWLVLTEWLITPPYDIDVKLFKVDGINIKPDTFYTLKDGKPIEVKGAHRINVF